MAWMAAHLFVEKADPAEVCRGITELLIEPQHCKSQKCLVELPAPVMISPKIEGWVAVTGAGSWLKDVVFAAQHLSKACNTSAVSCEIFGNCYRYRLGIFGSGETQKILRQPEQGWDQAINEHHLAMPIYNDVEQIAYRHLIDLKIPPSLVVLGCKPLGYSPQNARSVHGAITLLPRETQCEQGTIDFQLLDFQGPAAPVIPSRISQDFGTMLFEDRYLEGRPSIEAVDRLLEIEDEQCARAQKCIPAADISLTVTYYSSFQQTKLDALLKKRNRHTFVSQQATRPPWWHFWRYLGKRSK